jgi:hypothetical protein
MIPIFLNCSTCFGRHTAHHQELKNCNCSLWFYIRFRLPAAAMAEWELTEFPLQLQFLNSWWWAVCRPKHVEQLRNNGIINSTTRLHFFFVLSMNFSTVHIYTQTIHRMTQNKQYLKQHKNFGRVRAVPHVCELYPGINFTSEEKTRKNLSQGSRKEGGILLGYGTTSLYNLSSTFRQYVLVHSSRILILQKNSR